MSLLAVETGLVAVGGRGADRRLQAGIAADVDELGQAVPRWSSLGVRRPRDECDQELGHRLPGRKPELPVLVSETAQQVVGTVGDDGSVRVTVGCVGDEAEVNRNRQGTTAGVGHDQRELGVHAGHHTRRVADERRRNRHGRRVGGGLAATHLTGCDDEQDDDRNDEQPANEFGHCFLSLENEALTRDCCKLVRSLGSPKDHPKTS